MSRMIDDEEELKDYGLIEKCSNLITEEKRCLDTWDNENVNYKRCKEINCYKKQLKRLEAENEEIKEANQAWGLTVIRLREEIEELKVENKSLKEELAEKQQTLEACEAEYRRVVSKLNESRGNLTKLP